MFPLTPVALHEGWIARNERIVTCVSGKFVWLARNKPAVLLFDLDGREKSHNSTPTRSGKDWKVDVKLKDWAEIAVIEARE